MHSFAVALVTTFVGMAAAQAIDPSTVPMALRTYWCTTQQASCPLICLQTPGNKDNAGTEANDCDPTTLVYSCVCSNGVSPNASEYSQTVPYFLCTEANNQCVSNCQGATACQTACRDNHPCGATDPTRYNITSTSTTASATATGTGSSDSGFNNFAGGSATTAASSSNGKTSAGVVAINLGQSYGFGIVVLGIFAGFALAL